MTKVAVVSDAAHGFGVAVVTALAGEGFVVYAGVPDIDDPAVSRDLGTLGPSVRIRELDVLDAHSSTRFVTQVREEAGAIHVLVNNAMNMLRGFFEDLTDSEIRGVFDKNLFGTMSLTRAVLPGMRAAGVGRIVVISSVAGRIGAPTGSAYSASRFAQEGFAESLRQEVEPMGIYVSLVEPGITQSDSWTVDKGAGQGTGDSTSPYHGWFQRAEQLFDGAMRTSGITQEAVAAAVLRATTESRPRWRYLLGRRARLIVTLRRYLPGDWFERIYFAEVVRRLTRGRG